jgi:aspartate aminotransferase
MFFPFIVYSIIARQVKYLLEKYHIYTMGNGRINMCIINPSNVEYVAKGIDDAVRNVTE